MTIDFTKPVQTRDGRKVRILCTDAAIGNDSIVAIATAGDGMAELDTWQSDGRYVKGEDSDFDLINVPEKLVAYVNFYEKALGGPHDSRKAADMWDSEDRIACVRVEAVDGQFDD